MDDNFNDHFMDDLPEDEGKKKEQPRPETPEEREDREIAESTIERRHSTLRLMLLGGISLALLVLGIWVWTRYFRPCETGQMKGWILDINTQGALMKSYEGKMLVIAYADDQIATRDTLRFTIDNDSVARDAMRWSADGRRLVVGYKLYRGNLPWRGNTTRIVTDIKMDSDRVERLGPVPDTEALDNL